MVRKSIVLACILLSLALAAMLVGCGSGRDGSQGSSPGTPEGVAEAFWSAAMKHDVNATWDMFSERIQSAFESKAKWEKTMFTNDPKATVKAGKATVTGDTAEVPVTITYSTKEKSTQQVRLVKEGGVWKVDMP